MAQITIINNIPAITYLMLPTMNSRINENMPNTTLLKRQSKNNIMIPIKTNRIVPITDRACSIPILLIDCVC